MTKPNRSNWRRVFVAFLLLVGLWLVSWLGARWLIVRAPLDRADAIVVLSGSATLSERVQHAARLYAEKRAPKILLTTFPVLISNTYLCRPVAKRVGGLNKFIITNTRK